MRMTILPYILQDFNENGVYNNCQDELKIEFTDIIHAAITVGRRNWDDVLYHGIYSDYEVNFRTSLVQTFLTDNGNSRYLTVSGPYHTLDPSEKGAINYFLGCTFAHLLTMKLFNINWIMHLDVYQAGLYGPNPVNITMNGESNRRPDFIGYDSSNRWAVIEAKGRTQFKRGDLARAKEQTENLKTINDEEPIFRLAIMSYLNNNMINIRISDPPKPNDYALHLKVNMSQFLRDYYALPFYIVSKGKNSVVNINGLDFIVLNDPCKIFKVGIEKNLFMVLSKSIEDKEINFHKELESIGYFSESFQNHLKEIDENNKNCTIGKDGILIAK
jgi:hypothetical protein